MASADDAPVEAETGSSLLLNQPVVIDNGTATLKAGFAGSSKPKVRVTSRWRVFCGSATMTTMRDGTSLLQ